MEGIEDDNTDLVMLSPHLFFSHISLPVKHTISSDSLIRPIDLDLQTCLCIALDLDQVAQQITRLLSNLTMQPKFKDWQLGQQEQHNLLFFQGKVYIPDIQDLRQHMVSTYHDLSTMGHPGALKIFNKVKTLYWWPRIRQWIKSYVKECSKCQ